MKICIITHQYSFPLRKWILKSLARSSSFRNNNCHSFYAKSHSSWISLVVQRTSLLLSSFGERIPSWTLMHFWVDQNQTRDTLLTCFDISVFYTFSRHFIQDRYDILLSIIIWIHFFECIKVQPGIIFSLFYYDFVRPYQTYRTLSRGVWANVCIQSMSVISLELASRYSKPERLTKTSECNSLREFLLKILEKI